MAAARTTHHTPRRSCPGGGGAVDSGRGPANLGLADEPERRRVRPRNGSRLSASPQTTSTDHGVLYSRTAALRRSPPPTRWSLSTHAASGPTCGRDDPPSQAAHHRTRPGPESLAQKRLAPLGPRPVSEGFSGGAQARSWTNSCFARPYRRLGPSQRSSACWAWRRQVRAIGRCARRSTASASIPPLFGPSAPLGHGRPLAPEPRERPGVPSGTTGSEQDHERSACPARDRRAGSCAARAASARRWRGRHHDLGDRPHQR